MRVYLDEKFRASGLVFRAPRSGDAGYDLYALGDFTLKPGGRMLIPTGLHFEIPAGYVGLVKDRSSMALDGIHTMAGVIDSSYRGELRVMLLNVGAETYRIEAKRKIAQLVVVPYYDAEVEAVDTLEALSSTERGAGGFGSTGQ